MISISSFDVFDTCLTRAFAYPVDVFLEVGEISGENGWIVQTPREFMEARIAAESAARRRSASGEVSFADIYQQLTMALKLDAQVISKIQNLELDLEERSLHPIIETRHRIAQEREQGRQILFLSDMYLPVSFLERILRKHKFYREGDTLYVSGEVGRGKHDGALFEHARGLLKGDLREWIHVGDNPHSDVESPRQLGLIAEHFEHGLLNRYELQICPRIRLRHTMRSRFLAFTRLDRLTQSSCWNLQNHVREKWQSRLVAAMRIARLSKPGGMNPKEKAVWDVGADVMGPLLYGYVKWVMAQAAGKNLGELYFVEPHSQILFRTAEVIQAVHPNSIEHRYIETFPQNSNEKKPERSKVGVVSLKWNENLEQTSLHFSLVLRQGGGGDLSLGYLNSLRADSASEGALALRLVEALSFDNETRAWGEILQSGILAFSRIYVSLDGGEGSPQNYLTAILSVSKLFQENPTPAEIESGILARKNNGDL